MKKRWRKNKGDKQNRGRFSPRALVLSFLHFLSRSAASSPRVILPHALFVSSTYLPGQFIVSPNSAYASSTVFPSWFNWFLAIGLNLFIHSFVVRIPVFFPALIFILILIIILFSLVLYPFIIYYYFGNWYISISPCYFSCLLHVINGSIFKDPHFYRNERPSPSRCPSPALRFRNQRDSNRSFSPQQQFLSFTQGE